MANFNKALSGTLTFTGSQGKNTGVPLSGVLGFTGTMLKGPGKKLTATLSFIGTLTVVAALLRRFRPSSTLYLSGPTSTKFIN